MGTVRVELLEHKSEPTMPVVLTLPSNLDTISELHSVARNHLPSFSVLSAHFDPDDLSSNPSWPDEIGNWLQTQMERLESYRLIAIGRGAGGRILASLLLYFPCLFKEVILLNPLLEDIDLEHTQLLGCRVLVAQSASTNAIEISAAEIFSRHVKSMGARSFHFVNDGQQNDGAFESTSIQSFLA